MLVYPLEYLVIVLKRLSSIAVHMYQFDHAHDKHNNNVTQNELFSSIMQSMTDIFYSGKREKMFIDVLEKKEENLSDENSEESKGSNPCKENKEIDCIELEPVTVTSSNCLP